jgi:hypothetical protein
VLTIDTKCPNQVFYSWLELNRGWKRETLQITIFVYVCSTWSLVEFKIAFWDVNNENDVNGLSSFNLSYLIKPLANMCSQRTSNYKIEYFMFDWSIHRLFVLNRDWKRISLQIMIFVYICSTCGIVQLKTRFVLWITRNCVNGVILFHLYYLINLMAYMCSQWTPNVQMKYFIFDWLINRLFVLNTGWKLDSLQMMIVEIVCSTLCIVQLKTRFVKWTTTNNVFGVNLFHLSYLLTLMVYLCSQ